MEWRSGIRAFSTQLTYWAGFGSASPRLEKLGEMFADPEFDELDVMHRLGAFRHEPLDLSALPTLELPDTVLFPDQAMTVTVSRTDPLLGFVEQGGAKVGVGDRVGVLNPVFILDGIDRLDEGGAVAAALREALTPMQGAAFRDRYVELPFDLSEALFVATANRLGPLPAVLRELTVVEVPGYTEAEKSAIAIEHLLPLQFTRHGLTADHVRVTPEAVDAIARDYTREAGVWGLAEALGTVCTKVVRRRAEGDEATVEVTPQALAGMLGTPAPPEEKLAGRTGRPGVAVGLCWTPSGGDVLVVEASRVPGSGGLALTGRLGDVMQESAQVALSWLWANAERYGIDPAVPGTPTCTCTCSRATCRRRAPRPVSRWRPRWCPRSRDARYAAAWP